MMGLIRKAGKMARRLVLLAGVLLLGSAVMPRATAEVTPSTITFGTFPIDIQQTATTFLDEWGKKLAILVAASLIILIVYRAIRWVRSL